MGTHVSLWVLLELHKYGFAQVGFFLEPQIIMFIVLMKHWWEGKYDIKNRLGFPSHLKCWLASPCSNVDLWVVNFLGHCYSTVWCCEIISRQNEICSYIVRELYSRKCSWHTRYSEWVHHVHLNGLAVFCLFFHWQAKK